MADETYTDEELAALEATAPQEWLDAQTGTGIAALGTEGVTDAIIAAILEEDHSEDPLMPVLPIEATPMVSFYQCNSANYTSGRGGTTIDRLVIHYTSGSQTAEGAAKANCIYFGRESAGASAHYFVDDGPTIWQSVKDTDRAWHAGNWAMNCRSIGIEVCTAGAFTAKEIENLTWLVQYLKAKYNIKDANIIRHYDVTGKLCPAYYVDSTRWANLKATLLNSGTAVNTTGTTTSTSSSASSTASNAKTYKVTASNGLNVRSGAGTSYGKVTALACGTTIKVTDTQVSGSYTWGKLADGSGWVALDYTTWKTSSSASTSTTTTATSSKTYAVTASAGLNVRSGAGTSYGVVKAIACGKSVTVTETKKSGNYTWGKLSDGSGWVALDYTTWSSGYPTGTYKVTAGAGLNVRSGAGRSYSKVGALTCGTKVNVTAIVVSGSYIWGKISSGYICLKEGGSAYVAKV